MGFETPKMPTPEEMAKINRERMRTEEKLEAGDAEIKYDQAGKIINVNPTKEQRLEMKGEMQDEQVSRYDSLTFERIDLENKRGELPLDEQPMVYILEQANILSSLCESARNGQTLEPEKLLEVAKRLESIIRMQAFQLGKLKGYEPTSKYDSLYGLAEKISRNREKLEQLDKLR